MPKDLYQFENGIEIQMTRILIVGGYGHVGQKIARRLTDISGTLVVIAGRSADRARAAAQMFGCDWTTLDIMSPESWAEGLGGADIVFCCIDAPSPAFARAVLQHGLSYVDISATDSVLQRIEALDDTAVEHDALAVLSVGLAPGLTNLLARHVTECLPDTSKIDIGILLGLGDAHGPEAIDWTLRNLAPVTRADIHPMRFGADHKAIPTIPFDFSDQHALMRRGYPPVATRLALASPLVTAGSLTALVAEVALQNAERRERGVRHIDDLWRIEDFMTALANEDVTIGRATCPMR